MATGPTDPLRFLVDFATADLATLRPGDRLNLAEDLAEFVTLGAGTLMPTRIDPAAFSEDEIATLQRHAKGQLEFIADPRGINYALPEITISLALVPIGDQVLPTYYSGTIRDRFLLTMTLLLANDKTVRRRLRRCELPDCRRLFARVRKQRFCSESCLNRANTRAYRERLKKAGAAKRQRARPRRKIHPEMSTPEL